MNWFRTAPLLLACVSVGCSSARATPRITGPQPQQKPASRRQIIHSVLKQSVRIKILDGDEARKLGSGVVIASHTARVPESFVITNAHVVANDDNFAHENVHVLIDDGADVKELPAEILAQGSVPDQDLALVRVKGIALEPADLADEDDLELGDNIVVTGAPYGKDLSLSAGIVSQLELDRKTRQAKLLKTDAPIGYGASGGGIFSLETGKLLAVVEGYRTAKVDFAVQKQDYSFDVPMPGETFSSPAPKVRRFLKEKGFAALLPTERADSRTTAGTMNQHG